MDQSIPVIQVDATQNNPAVRLASGRFQLGRRLVAGPLLLLFVLAPWLQLNGAPLLWMDLPTRELHVLGLTFWPDDYLILTWLAIAAAFGLFTVATFAGRLWCGFACPQTIWSMMFIWVEEKTQGSRQKRLKELKLPFTKRRWLPLLIKHTLWLAIAFVTGFTFVAFFESGQGLWSQLLTMDLSSGLIFWLAFFTGLTYLNGGWLREQVCLHMCPYSRFQSVMLDKKSLKVTYQQDRGEPRRDGGDCIDCSLCVQVCPVGIDIRQGMQYACIDCAACIDVCDEVMEKVSKPTGLIRFDYDAQTSPQYYQPSDTPERNAQLHTSAGTKRSLKDLLRGRQKLWGYALLTGLSAGAFALQVSLSETLDAHLSRDRGQLYFYNGQGALSNSYDLKLHNKTQENKSYSLNVSNTKLAFSSPARVTVLAGKAIHTAVEIYCKAPCELIGTQSIELHVSSALSKDDVTLTSRFFAPAL